MGRRARRPGYIYIYISEGLGCCDKTDPVLRNLGSMSAYIYVYKHILEKHSQNYSLTGM